MSEPIEIHEYTNGLVLVAQRMPWVESAALTLLVPAGCSRDPADRLGLSNITCEMVQRGCGERDSRQFVSELENLGVDHNASVSIAHTSFGGAMPADKIERALPIYADLVRRPHLPADQLEDARLSCIHEIRASTTTWPSSRCSNCATPIRPRVGAAQPRDPGGDGTGRTGGCPAAFQGHVSASRSHSQYRREDRLRALREQVSELFGSWNGDPPADVPASRGDAESVHLTHDSNQTHLAIGYASVPYGDPLYYQARGAVGVLSDGMSSRLFTEVREKRGLCYAVYAVCHTLRNQASVFCYAGTTTDRAQETVQVVLEELRELRRGVQPDELRRLQARLKSVLIMQQESSSARSSSIAADWYYLGRVQTVEQVRQIVERLSCESVNAYLADHPPSQFTVVTLGQKQLEIPVEIP